MGLFVSILDHFFTDWGVHALRNLSLLLLLFGLVPLRAAPAWEKVLEDAPGRLVLELTPPVPVLREAHPGGPARPECPGCQHSLIPGAPDLPYHRFEVLSGTDAPRVSVQVLESESRSLPGGLASIPRQITPDRMEIRPDASLFRAAAAPAPRASGIRWFRGAPSRGIEIPLATWNEATRTLVMARRIRVEIEFPGVRSRPTPVRLANAHLAGLRNPVGGAWLYEMNRFRPQRALKKAAVGKAAQPGWPGEKFLRIKVGDKAVESLGEDQYYGVSFEELAAVSADLRGGIRIDSLRLYTGNNDTLHRRMDSLPADPMDLKGILREIPMEAVDRNGNETFDAGDTLKFFAHGTSTWKRLPGDSGSVRYRFTVDPYAYENHYFLGWSRQRFDGPALRLSEAPGLAPALPALESTPHYLRAEQDRETASCDPSSHKDTESGFAWFWHWKGRCDTYSDTAVTLTRSSLQSPETETLADLVQEGASDTVLIGFFTYQPSRENVFRAWFAGRADTLGHDAGQAAPGNWFVKTGPWQSQPAFLLDSVSWFGREKRFEGYTVRYRRHHAWRGKNLWIFPPRTGVRQTYRVDIPPGTSGVSALRIVDGVAERRFRLDEQGRFTDSLPRDADARYLVHGATARFPADAIKEDGLAPAGMALRDLLTGDGENPEYLIITDRSLQLQASLLRDFRKDPKRAMPLRTSVAHVEDIYRLFGSGRMSPVAIRDFLRWAYSRWDAGGPSASPLKHVVLLGDGHYDYRGIHNALTPNIVPPYEFIVEPSNREQVATEDFYGNLDPGDNHMDSAKLDLAVGRVPVQTPAQAQDYLAKVAAYENPALAGEWRGRVVLTADDHLQRGHTNDLDPISRGHTTDSERLGQAMASVEPAVGVDRVYLLDYPINSSFRKPEAAQDVLAMINRGALMVNYVGHGSSNQWADEVLLQTSDALSRIQNKNRTGLLNAFSCTVGRFESLSSEGMSEQFVKRADVGSIGAVSATRESFPIPNIALATAFYSRVFLRDSATGRSATVGEALRDAKNAWETSDNLNDMKYALLGEPVLLLRKPLLKVGFTNTPDTLKSLDCGTLRGTVAGGSGSGMVNLKIMAGSNQKIYSLPNGFEAQFAEKRGSILFERTLPYKDGKFSADYFLPRQISFGDTNARIVAFAWDGSREMEGSAVIPDLRIQGSASTCPADTNGQGPRIRITGCERKETGDLDFPDRVRLSLPYCLQIQVEDSVGGVLASDGPYEGTTLEVPGVLDPFHPQPGIDDLYLKTFRLSLDAREFRPGPHVLKISAQDGYGNRSQRALRMDLTRDSSIQTITAYNVPNPVKRSGTAFYFSTIIPQEEVIVVEGGVSEAERLSFEVRIFDQAGRVIKVMRDARSGVRWDGRDDWGNRAANGVYFYVVSARWDDQTGGGASTYRTLSTRRNTLVLSR